MSTDNINNSIPSQENVSVTPLPTSSSSSTTTSTTMNNNTSSANWTNRINQIQQSRMTPAIRQQLLHRAETSRMAQQNQLDARSAQIRNTAVYETVSTGLRQTMERSIRPMAAKQSYSSISENAVRGMSRAIQGTFGAASHNVRQAAVHYSTASAPIRSEALADIVPEELVTTMDTLHIPLQAVAADKAQEFHQLLQQLRTEPTNDEEITAKFAIFETYMDSVTVLRKDVYTTWESAKPQFESGAIQFIDQQLKRVDQTENLGIIDQDGVWIVYGMMSKASKNHTLLSSILKDIETKLALLASEVDCPMCLEPLGNGEGKKPAKILGCCHRTCQDCWTEWSAVHPHPFCPLCRQVDFVEELSRLATQG